MVHTYASTHYTSLQDSIASICKTILPFSFKKRRTPAIAAAEQRLSKQQSDNLKWQQHSFHRILNLMGLCKEGIVSENEVSAFRTHLLETLIASPIDHEATVILRDKLIFLQELLYAKCISEEEYHASKRPLLQRLAVQGAEIDARDVIVGAQSNTSNDEWSVIDLKDDKCSANQGTLSSTSKKNSKESSALKKMKGAASVFGFVSPDKTKKLKENNVSNQGGKGIWTNDRNENGHLNERESDLKTVLMMESLPEKHSFSDKAKKKVNNDSGQYLEKEKAKSAKKAWAFDGLKKWKKNDSAEDEMASLSVDEKSGGEPYGGKLVANPLGEGPDTKQIKRKLHPNGAPTDFFVDKVLGEKIKRELCRYPNVHLLDEQIEAVSTKLPVEKADLEKLFTKSWCDQYGDIVLDVVRKGFKEHMREMGNCRSRAVEKQRNTFDDQNSHPNTRTPVINRSIDKGFKYNPFFDM